MIIILNNNASCAPILGTKVGLLFWRLSLFARAYFLNISFNAARMTASFFVLFDCSLG
jgi:hypothetical protein